MHFYFIVQAVSCHFIANAILIWFIKIVARSACDFPGCLTEVMNGPWRNVPSLPASLFVHFRSTDKHTGQHISLSLIQDVSINHLAVLFPVLVWVIFY